MKIENIETSAILIREWEKWQNLIRWVNNTSDITEFIHIMKQEDLKCAPSIEKLKEDILAEVTERLNGVTAKLESL